MFSNTKGLITKKFNSKFKGILKKIWFKAKGFKRSFNKQYAFKIISYKNSKERYKDKCKSKSKQEEQYVQKYSRCPSKEIKKTKEEIT